jgi:hypothetical protein
MPPAEALAIVDLLTTYGHSFAFDVDTLSSQGLTATPGGDGSLQSTHKKFGAQALQITSGGSVQYATGYTGDTCLTAWKRDATNTTFRHCAVTRTRAGAVSDYLNGEPSLALVSNFMGIDAAGVVTLHGKDILDAGSVSQFDDLVILPWIPSDAMLLAWASATQAWTNLPVLPMTGSLQRIGEDGARAHVMGSVRSVRIMAGSHGGTFRDDLRAVSFSLEEV